VKAEDGSARVEVKVEDTQGEVQYWMEVEVSTEGIVRVYIQDAQEREQGERTAVHGQKRFRVSGRGRDDSIGD
jgi:hypothetical protein